MGALLTLLVLEACRRTTGPVMPIICVAFFLYAYYGGFLPISWPISHAGFDFSQIINGFYNDQSGIYGIPLDVCATYIVLFTIYGAVLDATGAGRFFIDISFATFRRSRSAPGRTVTLSGFLLGTVSGSGTATAVSLGSVAWPVLQRAGYPREQAGGMLAAAGIGAILSPPTLGAAAFIIAEYVGVPYLQVLLWATIPTLLYYAGILLAVEIDARRFGARAVAVTTRPARALLLRFGYHFLSLVVIVVFLALGIAPFRAVVYATLVAAVFGLVERAVSRRDPLDPDAVRRSLPPRAARVRHRALPGPRPRGPRGAARRVRLRRGRDHHLGHRQDRPRSEPGRPAGRGRAGAGHRPDRGADPHRAVRGRRDRRARSGRTGHRVVHHLVGGHRAGPADARRQPAPRPPCSSSTTRCCPR